jgi:hypothetical protein
MRRDVSHQQKTDRTDETLRALVRLLARAAAREALAASPEAGAEDPPSCPNEGSDHAG